MSRRNQEQELFTTNNIDVDEVLTNVEKQIKVIGELHDVPIIEIPDATLHGAKNNLKKIKSFKKLRQSYKVSNQKGVFLNDMKNMLKHMDISNNEFNIDLLVEVSNIANEFFIYGKSEMRETSKAEAVYELLLPYFGDNVHLLSAMLESVQYKIRHSSRLKRLYKRVYNFFCTIGKA